MSSMKSTIASPLPRVETAMVKGLNSHAAAQGAPHCATCSLPSNNAQPRPKSKQSHPTARSATENRSFPQAGKATLGSSAAARRGV